jgi:integrase/recombinase XerD
VSVVLRARRRQMAALTGKGRKTRHVPIDANTRALLTAYLAERQLDSPRHDDHPVFFNQHRAKLSRGAIAWILRGYQTQAADPALTNARISPHILRHSRAMYLYDSRRSVALYPRRSRPNPGANDDET